MHQETAAQTARPDGAPSRTTPCPSGIVCLPRSGQPPLRVRGHCLHRAEHRDGTERIEITLWRCDSGGYAAGLLLETAAGRTARAHRAAELDAAVAFAEGCDLPAALAASAPVARARSEALRRARALAERARAVQRGEAWRDLLGDALAAWPHAAAASSPSANTMPLGHDP